MNILICGASGFVGRNLKKEIQKNSEHDVISAVRTPIQANDIHVDYVNDTNSSIWIPRLQNIDVVINAVGILRDSRSNPMNKLHQDTPIALFKACEQVGIKKVIHLSALGIESGCQAAYFTSRIKAEKVLFQQPETIQYLCLRPSVIYGDDGDSARMFRAMASLPIQCLPYGGSQQLQPVHIDDISKATLTWIDDDHAQSMTVDAVGSEATTMRSMLDSYRAQLGYKSALHCSLPNFLTTISAKLGDYIPSSPLCSETLSMMEIPNTSQCLKFKQLLRQTPRSYKHFIA